MAQEISQKSKRVARNTLLLYFRMLLLMFIGLFTSRVVLRTLGVDDFGTYNVVYSIVMMFSVLSNSISSSIQRFLAFELGKGDEIRMKKVFSSALLIQCGLVAILFCLAETLGVWYLENKAAIPVGREHAAMWAFQSCTLLLAIQLFSIPFNSAIIVHEDMKAFAWISLLEGALKLCVAITLYFATIDKLILYSVLMVCVAAINRGAYAYFCHRHYKETKSGPRYDRESLKAMLSLGAWSFTAYGVGVFNTQGVNILSNSVFGVRINAARGVAGQIENIVKQFVNNFLTALTPLIVKTWAENDREYCFALVRKGCKYSYLIVLLFALPFIFGADTLLTLWLGEVPDHAVVFTQLAVLTVMADMMSNSLAQLILAEGKVSIYYLVTSSISALTFIGVWIAFSLGAGPESAYVIAIVILITISVARLFFANRLCGFPIGAFLKEVAGPLLVTTLLPLSFTLIPRFFWPGDGLWKALVCILCSVVTVCILAYAIALTPGEKSYIRSLCESRIMTKVQIDDEN